MKFLRIILLLLYLTSISDLLVMDDDKRTVLLCQKDTKKTIRSRFDDETYYEQIQHELNKLTTSLNKDNTLLDVRGIEFVIQEKQKTVEKQKKLNKNLNYVENRLHNLSYWQRNPQITFGFGIVTGNVLFCLAFYIIAIKI